MIYTIKTISHPEKVRALHRNMLIPISHILQTVDEAPNICPMKKNLKRKLSVSYEKGSNRARSERFIKTN